MVWVMMLVDTQIGSNLQSTENTIIRSAKNNEQQNQDIRFLDLLEMLNIKPDNFVDALSSFIGSKPFEKMVAPGLRKKAAAHEESPYPRLYLHVLINFIMNATISEDGYHDMMESFLSGHSNHDTDQAPVVNC